MKAGRGDRGDVPGGRKSSRQMSWTIMRRAPETDGPGEGDTMQGPGCQQGRGQQGAETLSREDGREPPRRIRLLTKHTLGDKRTKNLKAAVTER